MKLLPRLTRNGNDRHQTQDRQDEADSPKDPTCGVTPCLFLGQFSNWRLHNGIPASACAIFFLSRTHAHNKAIVMPFCSYQDSKLSGGAESRDVLAISLGADLGYFLR